MKGVVFDTGALIALERGSRLVMTIITEARQTNATVTVPAVCVAQGWRDPSRQARLAVFLRLPNVAVVPLDDTEARLVGLLLARVGSADIADAHVAVCARRLRQTVLTSDPKDLLALDARLQVHAL